MRNIIILLIVCLLLMIAGCNKEPSYTGYIMDKKDQEILIVSSVAKDYSENGGIKEFYDAIWATDSPDDVKVGQKVKVWFKGGVAATYPGQASIRKVEVIPSPTPKGATLSEADALNKALTQFNFGNVTFTVHSISYDSVKDTWTIIIKNTGSYKEHRIEVEDKTFDGMINNENKIYYASWTYNPFLLIVGGIILFTFLTLLIFKFEKFLSSNKSR